MIDLSEEEVDYNIQTTKKYLERAAPMKQWLEMEIGITGGEEDGVNNEDVDNNSLYTQPEDIYEIFKTLSEVSPLQAWQRQAPAPAPLQAPEVRPGEDWLQG